MSSAEKFDCVVVGAGPAGIACGYMLAKAGLSTVIFERGDYPGSKNVMGGVLYRQMTEEIIPRFWEKAPLERPIVEQQLWVLSEKSGMKMGYSNQDFAQEPYNNFTVLRAKFDRWFAGQAEEAGALIINKTVVEDFIIENGKIVGVKTDRADGDLFCDVVVLAEGVNSLLSKKIGLHAYKEIPPKNVALSVKEVIALPKEIIDGRFGLKNGQGVTIELVGEITKGMMGLGFLYTNNDSLSLGVGVVLADLRKNSYKPYDLLEGMKEHPLIGPLLEGGKPIEYLGHLIPEGGYKAVPKLYSDGVLVVGDAAMLVNSLHREGSNLALTSGRLAAETVIKAKEKNDFSAQSLSFYQKLLEDSFVMKDLKKYKNAPGFFDSHPYLFSLYPEIADFALKEMVTVDGVSKKEKQKKIWKKVRKKRGIFQIIQDLFQIWRVLK
ncbi:MAG: FAD-dependent oxidoreductase [Elusimicrobiota bacterium]